MLLVFQTPAAIYQDAKAYLAIFLLGYVAIFLYMQLTSIYRCFGDAVFQMKGMLLGTILNAIIDPLFIRAIEIKGAAVATVLSQMSCLGFVVVYGKKKSIFSTSVKGIQYGECGSIIEKRKDRIKDYMRAAFVYGALIEAV